NTIYYDRNRQEQENECIAGEASCIAEGNA
ncbi:hypothetical protein EVA_18252, partial [gut metagenome]